jgi:hypothetical protein
MYPFDVAGEPATSILLHTRNDRLRQRGQQKRCFTFSQPASGLMPSGANAQAHSRARRFDDRMRQLERRLSALSGLRQRQTRRHQQAAIRNSHG